MEPDTFRQVLGHYPTGVSIVTAVGRDGAPIGMTIGSFNSVSLDPPLVAFYSMRTSSTFGEIRESGSFVVNVLGADQAGHCRAFGRQRGERFQGIGWNPGVTTNAPVLTDATAWLECDIERVEEAGDHFWVLGRVCALDVGTGHEPLVFFRGGYGKPADTSDPRFRWYVDLTEQL